MDIIIIRWNASRKQSIMQGKKDGCKEWPIEGESLFSYKGEPLPYMPFRFSREYAKDNAPGWFRTFCETGISDSKKISRGMPQCTLGY